MKLWGEMGAWRGEGAGCRSLSLSRGLAMVDPVLSVCGYTSIFFSSFLMNAEASISEGPRQLPASCQIPVSNSC